MEKSVLPQSRASNFKYSFLLISLFGFMCSLYRSDYNVALGIFAYSLWAESQFPQKHRILWLLLASLIGDGLWLLLVSLGRWGEEPNQHESLRDLTRVVALMNLAYKMGLIVYARLQYDECRDLFTLGAIRKKLLYL